MGTSYVELDPTVPSQPVPAQQDPVNEAPIYTVVQMRGRW